MHVAVNTTGLTLGPGDETGAYLRNVLEKTRQTHGHVSFTLITDPRNLDSFDGFTRAPADVAPDADPADRAKVVDRLARRAEADLLLTPLECPPGKKSIPYVLLALNAARVVRDVKTRRWRAASALKALKASCANAKAVIAPSETARRTLLDLLEVPLNHAAVARPGTHDGLEEPRACFVEKPYLVLAGNTDVELNVAMVHDVFRRLRSKTRHNLVLLGLPGTAEPDQWCGGVMRFESAPVAQLAALYQHADLALCPAFYPGAALAALEAMRAGTRVVAARAGALPEVAGNSAVYFDPKSGRSMLEAIGRVLHEVEQDRAKAIKEGRARAAKFTWADCAAQVLRALRHGLT